MVGEFSKPIDPYLKKIVTILNNMDHPLTPIIGQFSVDGVVHVGKDKEGFYGDGSVQIRLRGNFEPQAFLDSMNHLCEDEDSGLPETARKFSYAWVPGGSRQKIQFNAAVEVENAP